MDSLSPEALFCIAVTVGAFVLFVTDLVTVDVVGLLAIVSLILGGVLTPDEALEGFASPAIITIGSMFVLAAGLGRTGVLDLLGHGMKRLAGGSRVRLLIALFGTVAVSSAFVNNTPIVVIFLPVVLGMAAKLDLAPSQLLLPMSYASILGGTCTLIGTSTNLLVSQVAKEHGYPPIPMFEISGAGLIFAAIGFLFLATIGRSLLPRRSSVSTAVEAGKIREFVTEIMFAEGSPLVGKSYQEAIGKIPGIAPLMVIRGDDLYIAPLIKNPATQFVRAGDIVLLKGEPGSINAVFEREGVSLPPELGELIETEQKGKTVTMVELVINPNSPLLGRTIAGADFRKRYGDASPIAVLRRDEHIRERVSDIRLRLGDTLLCVVDENRLGDLRNTGAFILLEGVEQRLVRRDKAPLAASIMALVVVFATLDILPIAVLALLGVTLMVLTRCIPIRLAYSSIDFSILVLIAGMLALGAALEKTAVIHAVAEWGVTTLQAYGPLSILAGIYLLTAILTATLSNNAVAALMTPLAIDVGETLGYEPAPFLFAVLFGASACFATPMGYQTHLFVYGPGGYRFTDFLRIGIPLNVVLFIAAMLVIPWIWPLTPIG